MKQPEALQLADRLRDGWGLELRREAEAELRRLHEENEALKSDLRMEQTISFRRQMQTYAAQRDALLEALRLIHIECQHLHHAKKDQHGWDQPCPVLARVNAAIAKAEGQA